MKKKFDIRLIDQDLALKPSKGDLRRTAVIQAALKEISTKGIHETSLFSVAKTMKVRRSLVTHYFKNMDELLEAVTKYVLRLAQEITVSQVAAAVTPEETLTAIVEATFEWVERERANASLIELALYYASFDPRYKQLGVTMRKYAEDRILAVLDHSPKWKSASAHEKARRGRMIRMYHVGAVISRFSCFTESEAETLKKEVIRHTLELAGF